jgi:hypothetical protein
MLRLDITHLIDNAQVPKYGKGWNQDPFRSVRHRTPDLPAEIRAPARTGANEKDGVGDINTDVSIGAGLSDS